LTLHDIPQQPSSKPALLSDLEAKAWTDIKNLHDLSQTGVGLGMEHQFTLAQKAAF